MSNYKFSGRSLKALQGVHPDLKTVMERALACNPPCDFTVIEGRRSYERQADLYAEGKSQTMNSRHLTGHAVDVVPYVNGGISWEWADIRPLAAHIKRVACVLGVDLDWGGDWESFPDGPHYELAWGAYGKQDHGARVQVASAKPGRKA